MPFMSFISDEEQTMAKSQKKSSRDVKKPKQTSNKPAAAPIFSVPPKKK